MRSICLPVILWIIAAPLMVLGQTTRPGPTPGLDRLRASLDNLNLTDDQKSQLKPIFDDARDQILDMRQNGGQTPQGTQKVMQGIRQKLTTILTTPQLQQLRQQMQDQQADTPARPPVARTPDPATPTAQTGDPAKTDSPKILEAGQTAPNFRLSKLDGPIVELSSLKGRVIVLVFGSYSSPMLRDRAAGLNRLEQQLGTKAEVYLVYTKEMHSVGGWDSARNEADHVVEIQPKTMQEKEAAARQCRTSLHLTLPILMDDMQDTTTTAYGAYPDGAVVINRNGTIEGSQQWAEPTALRRIIDQAVAKQYHPASP
jgi:Iodothyronine deiodinase